MIKTLRLFLAGIWLRLLYGYECARDGFAQFLWSWALIPQSWFMSHERRVDQYTTAIIGELQKLPLPAADITLFRNHPELFVLHIAHKATLPLWHSPWVRLETMQRVSSQMRRYWRWKLGVSTGQS